MKTKNNKQTTQQGAMKTKPTKRKQQQQQHEDGEMQKQQKITRYVRKGEDQENEMKTTTTKPEMKQQQQTNDTGTKQQQQQPPRMTVKSKGIVISDLKGFLEKRKAERAARVNEVKNNVKSAECHDKLNLSDVQSALRPRPGEISGPDEQLLGKTGVSKGY